MAISKAFIASLLISLRVLQLVEADVVHIFMANTQYKSIYLTKYTSYIYPFPNIHSGNLKQKERLRQ